MIFEIIIIFLTLLLIRHWISRPQGLPPGPFVYPLVGSGFVTTLKKAKKYKDKYGNIFRTEVFGFKLIYLCDFKLVKEAFNKFEFADRPSFEGFHFMTEGKEAGVIMSNGQKWSNARRFLLRNLRDLGMGKSYLDEPIIKEAKFLVEDFKKFAGKPTPIPESLNIAVLNVVWQMVASCRYDLYDKQISEFIRIVRSLQDDTMGMFLMEFCPPLKKLPKSVKNKIFKEDALLNTIRAAKKLFGDTLEHRKSKLDPSNPENVIDQYLIQIKEKTDISEFFDETDLLRVVFDLFGAGFDTTSNMLRWVMLYAAKYPNVHRCVQKQIDEVLPKGELATNIHKTKLPLVEAFIHESLRMSSLVPLGVMHATNTDTTLSGYFIPKGSIIFGAAGVSHHDPRYWKDPEEFRLERFLDEEGQFVSQKEGFAPFGIGKRSCLGEALARMELSIFGAALLQNFTFSAPEGKSIDITPADLPLGHIVRKQDIIITARD